MSALPVFPGAARGPRTLGILGASAFAAFVFTISFGDVLGLLRGALPPFSVIFVSRTLISRVKGGGFLRWIRLLRRIWCLSAGAVGFCPPPPGALFFHLPVGVCPRCFFLLLVPSHWDSGVVS